MKEGVWTTEKNAWRACEKQADLDRLKTWQEKNKTKKTPKKSKQTKKQTNKPPKKTPIVGWQKKRKSTQDWLLQYMQALFPTSGQW